MKVRVLFAAVICAVLASGKDRQPRDSALDKLIRESEAAPVARSGGSLWSPNAGLADLAADLRPRHVNDIVTIVVRDRASAISRGATKANRASSARAGINSLGGTPPGGARLPQLLDMSGQTSLEGQGETSRETVLTTSLSARVTHVLPNGLLVIEGRKAIRVNSENQLVTIRGLVRPYDVTYVNTVYSDQLAELEIAVDGKGVVGDAIRRPNILYRILLGILPF